MCRIRYVRKQLAHWFWTPRWLMWKLVYWYLSWFRIIHTVDCFFFLEVLNEIIPCAFQKTDAMTLPTDGTVFAFFLADYPLSVHYFDCYIVSGVSSHISSMVMNQLKNSVLLVRNIAKHWTEASSWRCFLFHCEQTRTYPGHSFVILKFSVNIRCTILFKIVTMSAIWRTINQIPVCRFSSQLLARSP